MRPITKAMKQLQVITTCVLLTGLSALWTDGVAQSRVTVEKESRLWIEGTSTVNSFTCESTAAQGFGHVRQNPNNRSMNPQTSQVDSSHAGEVVVQVETFDCGKKKMNRDLQRALRSAAFPEIRFVLSDAEVAYAPNSPDEAYLLHVSGHLTIAGKEVPTGLTANARAIADGKFHAWGSRELFMSDFGIDPPSTLFGLIKARDRIVVRFDLLASRDRQTGSTVSVRAGHQTQEASIGEADWDSVSNNKPSYGGN